MQTDKSVERPLHSLRVIEFEGIGPGPLAGRMLSDLGAHVIVVVRPTPSAVDRTLIGENTENPLRQGKEIIVLDLKTAKGVSAALDLVADADALIEGNRPGVMERLGLGPAECAVRNARLVYGRMTGWGQSGPLAQAAGHDLNYIALTGLLSLSGPPLFRRPFLAMRQERWGFASAWSAPYLMPALAGAGVWSTPPSSMSSQCSVRSCKGYVPTARSMGPDLARFTILPSMTPMSARTGGSSQSAR